MQLWPRRLPTSDVEGFNPRRTDGGARMRLDPGDSTLTAAPDRVVGVLPYGLRVATSQPVGVNSESLPIAFKVWVFGALVSQLGDAAMYFALGWAASAHGGAAAGLVLSGIAFVEGFGRTSPRNGEPQFKSK